MADILGRRGEVEAFEQLLAGARAGHSGVLVVHGEAGIGKSALLEHVRDTAAASGFRVETSVGVESETQFAFAGLHQLCASLLDRVAALPEPQQAALGVALGQRGGVAPDRFLVGLATLNLLAEVAEEAPLLCLVDDAQWLDQASAEVLAFVARRLAAERVALVFARRDATDRDATDRDVGLLTGLPELCLEGLDDSDARALLAAAVRSPIDDRVRDRIVAEARGNPLALLELPRGGRPTQLAGGFEMPDAVGVPRRIEDAFRQRSGSLPARHPAAAAGGCGRPDGRRGGAVARCGASRDRPRGRRARRDRRAGRDRRSSAVPSSAGALSDLPRGHTAGPSDGPRRVGRRHRCTARSRSGCLAPGAGGAGHR